MTVPHWVQDAVFYQIFPDRFANGDPMNDPPNVQPWGTKPTRKGFQGGDLQGVIQQFDYLLDLGVNALYFNPIFQATSNHRYNTTDYYTIDPMLGTLEDFRQLIALAHRNGVRIVLDGVFNHCGRGFFAFNDLLENQKHSRYIDWFHVESFPIDAYGTENEPNYLAWWEIRSLPKFNTDNPSVRKYLLDIARYWIEQGADGWRLDVPNEIDDDSFWAEFREVVKRANPDAYLVGEIWEVSPRWVGPDHFDGLMNYPMRDAILNFLSKGTLTASAFAQEIDTLFNQYPPENAYAQYLPLGSHDTKRLLTVFEGDVDKVRLAFLLQFCYPGAPAIYYGDEIGLEGDKDPDCRRAFPIREADWDHHLRSFVQELVTSRHQLPQLRRGDFRVLMADDEVNVCAFGRVIDEQASVILLNASNSVHTIGLPVIELGWMEGDQIHERLNGEEFIVTNSELRLQLPPLGGMLLSPSS